MASVAKNTSVSWALSFVSQCKRYLCKDSGLEPARTRSQSYDRELQRQRYN
jgi:hypothetical protein